jgi:flavin reductase (DIM6/NTAB) family NADH-FMN oxidoreductase RutF
MSNPAENLQELAMALGRVPSGLFILTARHEAFETGLLVSWVQQCSFEPPQVSVCLRRGRDVLDWLGPGAAFTLNLLAEGQSNLLSHFGKGFALGQLAFTGLNVIRHLGQAPVLADALGYLVCRVAGRVAAGDHELLLGAVEGGQLLRPDARPWVHVRKNALRY